MLLGSLIGRQRGGRHSILLYPVQSKLPQRQMTLFSYGFPRTWLRLALPSFLGLAACGDEVRQSAQTPQRVQPSRPLLDSLRARRNAALAKRPDTLGMRADSGRILGDSSANVWVIVTSDFQCTACREFAVRVLPTLRKEFVDNDLVRLAFVNNPQERNFNARFAAHAALCAATGGRFWPMHDTLFATQHVWDRMPDPRPYMDSLAVAVGVPADKQADCTSRNRMLLRLTNDIEQSRQSGVTSVPTVFVGDRRLGSNELTPRAVERAVREALAERR
jgi:protein-disulfide isomerase